MSITVNINLGHEFAVKAPFEEVWALLSDIPTSVSFFPKVDRLTDLGGGVYRWEMDKVGTAQAHIQTVYVCQYVSNKAQGSVVWTPVRGQGNAQIGGSWQISDQKQSTAVAFRVQGSVDVPLPGLMTMFVAPVVKLEFEKLVEQFMANLIERLGGEA